MLSLAVQGGWTKRNKNRKVGKEMDIGGSVEEMADKPFYALIPNTKDKVKVMRQLHNALDGKNGIELIRYLRAAIELDYLTHMPTLGELTGEFCVDITRSYYYRNKDKDFPNSILDDYKDQLC